MSVYTYQNNQNDFTENLNSHKKTTNCLNIDEKINNNDNKTNSKGILSKRNSDEFKNKEKIVVNNKKAFKEYNKNKFTNIELKELIKLIEYTYESTSNYNDFDYKDQFVK